MPKKPVSALQVGDVILPPPRELSLWMRRTCAEKGLPESALYLTVREIREGDPDTKGRWLRIVCDQTAAWSAPREAGTFSFKARPETLWVKV